eukprot:CAMPEP_0176386016 /NCGR_PEP_ID=MMETSP0126-20121128/35596_1 /TAXON_ID=141414 ORGANISM="Strombidinopsis acuminatum, Strain SPMC142" /NCGR_SAMPLE_ID=MMETSP0126 /ASSEMBLY_ACC=CAM_ASM_000229 /LENGTH=93 /DNA_ID=CAMNT_0017752691 /DNA_START=410 /DNA_END=691 /DNA_ORIENTATION=+
MTSAAQFALRRIVEKYSKTTNESVLNKLVEVCKAEELIMEPGATEAIVSLSGGDMRKVLNILESCCLSYKEISLTKIYEVTGRPSPKDMDVIF